MANSTVLASLNRILESQERREQTELQQSLAMMEMAQKSRAQDFTMVMKQLEIGEKSNKEARLGIAKDFINQTGLSGIIKWDKTTDKGVAIQNLDETIRNLTGKKWGRFSPRDAHKLANAVWEFQQQNSPTGIINIIDELGEQGPMYDAWMRAADYDNLFMLDEEDVKPMIWQARETKRIEDVIKEERDEVASGDFRIDQDLGLADMPVPPEPLAGEDPLVIPDEGGSGFKVQLSEQKLDLSKRIVSIDSELKELAKISEEFEEKLRDARLVEITPGASLTGDQHETLKGYKDTREEHSKALASLREEKKFARLQELKIQQAINELEISGIPVLPPEEDTSFGVRDIFLNILSPVGEAAEALKSSYEAGHFSPELVKEMLLPFEIEYDTYWKSSAEEGEKGISGESRPEYPRLDIKFRESKRQKEMRERSGEPLDFVDEVMGLHTGYNMAQHLESVGLPSQEPLTIEGVSQIVSSSLHKKNLREKWGVDNDADAEALEKESTSQIARESELEILSQY